MDSWSSSLNRVWSEIVLDFFEMRRSRVGLTGLFLLFVVFCLLVVKDFTASLLDFYMVF